MYWQSYLVFLRFSVSGESKIFRQLKKDYAKELENLNNLRKDFELKIDKYLKEQEEAKENYLKIIQVNEEQNKRIKILEIQEKASSFITASNFRRALEYISLGLELDPKNIVLLSQKATCLWKLNDLSGAAAALKTLIDLEPSKESATVNLMELYLLLNKIEDFNNLYKPNKTVVESRGGETGVKYYFEVLKKYQFKKYDDLKELVEKYIALLPPGKGKQFHWDFSDLQTYLKAKPPDMGTSLLLIFINLAKGDISTEEAKVEIGKINNSLANFAQQSTNGSCITWRLRLCSVVICLYMTFPRIDGHA